MKLKLRHNKKRNTAFLYEALVRELTQAALQKEEGKKNTIVSILKQHFRKNTALREELECYKALMSDTKSNFRAAEKLVQNAKGAHAKINKKHLFNEQTRLINAVNKKVSNSVFSNFVPNYKSLATLYQIFNQKTALETRVLLEEAIISDIAHGPNNIEDKTLKPINNLVFNSFIKKFNKEYSTALNESQQELLNQYIMSFADNGVALKVYLNEEIGLLKEKMQRSLRLEEIIADPEMTTKSKEIIKILEGFREQEVNEIMIKKVLKIQKLVREIEE